GGGPAALGPAGRVRLRSRGTPGSVDRGTGAATRGDLPRALAATSLESRGATAGAARASFRGSGLAVGLRPAPAATRHGAGLSLPHALVGYAGPAPRAPAAGLRYGSADSH